MSLSTIFQAIGNVFALYWWILVLVIFAPLYSSLSVFVTHEQRKRKNKWVILDIKISRETVKTPQAMEQILETMNGWGTLPSLRPTEWASLELISIGGEIHFLVRILEKYKHLLESTFFSFYQDVEIKEVDDYALDRVPSNTAELYARGNDIWGSEIMLSKEAAYPIKSYKEFGGGGEGTAFDPMSVFTEILGRLNPEEFIGIQIILMPLRTKAVQSKYKLVLEKLKAKPQAPGADPAAPKSPVGSDSKKAKAVEENLSKPFFDTLIRAVYIAPKTAFREKYAKQGIVSSFNQYASHDLNSFTKNGMTEVGDVLPNPEKRFVLFPERRNEARKERLLHTYRHRDVPSTTFMGQLVSSMMFHNNMGSKFFEFSTEGLATIFHLPTTSVLTAPFMQRVESRKVGPPQGLAIFGEDKDLEIFE